MNSLNEKSLQFNKKIKLDFDFQIMQKILPAITGSELIIKDILIELFNYCSTNDKEISAMGEYIKNCERELKSDRIKYKKSAKKILMMLRGYENGKYQIILENKDNGNYEVIHMDSNLNDKFQKISNCYIGIVDFSSDIGLYLTLSQESEAKMIYSNKKSRLELWYNKSY